MRFSPVIAGLLISVFLFPLQVSGQSVLSSGSWYRLGITQTGVYRIDYDFLNQNGIDPASVNPSNIALFGFGGGMLPQENSAPMHLLSDSELAITMIGGNDGSFDPEDEILFFIEGPDSYEFNSSQQEFAYQKNLYTDTVYLFLNLNTPDPKRISDNNDLGVGSPTITTYNDYLSYQTDDFNLIKSGREWYGERFLTTLNQQFVFEVPGLKDNSLIKVVSSVMAASGATTEFEVSLNDFLLGSQSILPIPSGTYSQKGRDRTDTLAINTNLISGNELNISLNYVPSSSERSIGYLNYLYLSFERNLALYGDQTSFRSFGSTSNPVSDFRIDDPGRDVIIWNVSDPLEVQNQVYNTLGGEIRFSTETDELQEFIIVDRNTIPMPDFTGPVENQDLLDGEDPELVIVTPEFFISEAERLAAFRNQNDGLEVKVVTLREIYNEFSSGAQDVSAIRNYMRYLYQTGDNLKYLLLFGDGSYDYMDRVPGNTNFVPTYQARNSLHPIFSYSSDDYFGFLDDNEGTWEESFSGDHILDIGIGRFPVQTIEEARDMVDKMITYSDNSSTFGEWRNEIYFVADDGDGNRHQEDADKLAVNVDTLFSQFNVNKIYVDAFEQVPTANGETSLATREAISRAVEKGTIVINYTGHGGEIGWAEESILDNPTIESWENLGKLPLFVTATCEFGRNDDPSRKSGGELLVLSSKGGSIGLLTTTRPVFASSNQLVNKAFYEIIFDRSNGEYPRLGDIVRYTKNNSLNGRVNRNFLLLGDPSLRLNYPEDKIRITAINDQPVAGSDTLKALSLVNIKGEITNTLDEKLDDFSGIVTATVFDKPVELETLGNDGPKFTYNDRNIILFRGDASVNNGDFELEFVVPKNIQFNYGQAKISLYASNSQKSVDANGSNIELVLGGSNPNPLSDTDPPLIELFMDDSTFVDGGSTAENTTLLAFLFDENGINISSAGVGQEIKAELDGEEKFILNEFYKSDLNTFQSGKVTFPLKELSTGEHILELRASDTYNNSATETITFIVADNEKLALEQVLNYPNPFNSITTFAIDHNRAGDDLEVRIEIFTVKGDLIKELTYEFENSDSRIDGLTWDAREDLGTNLGRGLYLYRVVVRSKSDGAKNQRIEKLVIIN